MLLDPNPTAKPAQLAYLLSVRPGLLLVFQLPRCSRGPQWNRGRPQAWPCLPVSPNLRNESLTNPVLSANLGAPALGHTSASTTIRPPLIPSAQSLPRGGPSRRPTTRFQLGHLPVDTHYPAIAICHRHHSCSLFTPWLISPPPVHFRLASNLPIPYSLASVSLWLCLSWRRDLSLGYQVLAPSLVAPPSSHPEPQLPTQLTMSWKLTKSKSRCLLGLLSPLPGLAAEQ